MGITEARLSYDHFSPPSIMGTWKEEASQILFLEGIPKYTIVNIFCTVQSQCMQSMCTSCFKRWQWTALTLKLQGKFHPTVLLQSGYYAYWWWNKYLFFCKQEDRWEHKRGEWEKEDKHKSKINKIKESKHAWWWSKIDFMHKLHRVHNSLLGVIWIHVDELLEYPYQNLISNWLRLQ